MRFHADLHIHSKYSRATSKDCDLEHLAYWAAKKGIGVVGTGDFTHPAWRAELKEKLVPAEPGPVPPAPRPRGRRRASGCRRPAAAHGALHALGRDLDDLQEGRAHAEDPPPDLRAGPRGAPTASPRSLARIGNIASDGRPILGLDSRHLLEIALESAPGAYLVPAHIWTPWFAVLGSRSGFDSVLECYGDLAGHVFAVETGLSSDPAMNWRVASLDRFRLVSSSDAHSPAKLGREATRLRHATLDYFAIRRALRDGRRATAGTVEFFPEEGKYHLDGHRKCNLRLEPEETRAARRPLPRLRQAADRGRAATASRRWPTAARPRPPRAAAAPARCRAWCRCRRSCAEITGTGVGAQGGGARLRAPAGRARRRAADAGTVPLEDVARASSALLAEGIARLRAGRVMRDAGYDGEYGTIRLFEESELEARPVRRPAVRAAGAAGPAARPRAATQPPRRRRANRTAPDAASGRRRDPARSAALDPDQRAAAARVDGPLLIVAGPGSGKTRMLTHRIAHLVRECGAPPASCLAVTFTRRAAGEMRERLAALCREQAGRRRRPHLPFARPHAPARAPRSRRAAARLPHRRRGRARGRAGGGPRRAAAQGGAAAARHLQGEADAPAAGRPTWASPPPPTGGRWSCATGSTSTTSSGWRSRRWSPTPG